MLLDVTADILKITLTDDQRLELWPLLDVCREQNNYEGILCSIARAYCPAAGGTVLELQVVQLPRAKVTKLKQLIRPDRQ